MADDLLIETLPKDSIIPHLTHDCSNRLAVVRSVRMAGVGEELNLRVVGSTQGDLMIMVVLSHRIICLASAT